MVKKMKKIKILLMLGLVSFFASVADPCFAQSADQKIRVKIFADAPVFTIVIKGDYTVKENNSDRIFNYGKKLKAKVAGYKGGILLAGRYLAASNIFIKPNNPEESVEINGRRFKGGVQVIKRNVGALSVINHLRLEDYVKGISVRETSHYWPMETLKAETVVFRTFALYRAEQFKNKEWDVSDDVFSQVYGGVEAERYRITDAVDKTKGEILQYDGKILPAFYHSTCGGATEDANVLWNIDLAPLKGVACSFCKDSPHFSWKTTISKEKIRLLWEKNGQRIKKINEVVIAGRDKSGRVMNLDIVTDQKDIEIAAKDFRNMIGPDIIKSTNFKIIASSLDLTFEGFGWGHGVGLCQWGAYFMGKFGSDYLKILDFYYPGSNLIKLSN
jgi:stage II sporulation protein D